MGTRPDNTVTVEVEGSASDTVVPAQQDIVTVRVLSVNPRFAKVHILCVGEVVLSEPFRGQVRKEDVRATEKDRVEMYKCFRPGDIVLARVISLGDASAGYLLTTAENELGVVIAKSEAVLAWCPCPGQRCSVLSVMGRRRGRWPRSFQNIWQGRRKTMCNWENKCFFQ